MLILCRSSQTLRGVQVALAQLETKARFCDSFLIIYTHAHLTLMHMISPEFTILLLFPSGLPLVSHTMLNVYIIFELIVN